MTHHFHQICSWRRLPNATVCIATYPRTTGSCGASSPEHDQRTAMRAIAVMGGIWQEHASTASRRSGWANVDIAGTNSCCCSPLSSTTFPDCLCCSDKASCVIRHQLVLFSHCPAPHNGPAFISCILQRRQSERCTQGMAAPLGAVRSAGISTALRWQVQSCTNSMLLSAGHMAA
jgi:hypothetical protein